MDRRWFGVMVVCGVVVPVANPHRPTAQESPATGRVVWTAEEKLSFQVSTVHQNLERVSRYRWRVRFTGVQDDGAARRVGAQRRWLARRVEWEWESFSRGPGTFFEDGRRWHTTDTTTCAGSGQVDLGPTEAEYNEGWPEMAYRCETVAVPEEDHGRLRRGSSADSKRLNVRLEWPRHGCADGEARRTVDRQGGVETASWSVTVSPYVEARVQVKFPGRPGPVPGARVELEGNAAAPIHWKFVLSPVSRLRGYATNADITPEFFDIYELPNLRDQYGTLAPDLIFDPFLYEERSRAGDWKRPRPESGPGKWSTLESAQASNRAFVEVTMMDFGAHGELRAYASSGCGGGWIPVPIFANYDSNHGLTRLTIPEDKDRNFMADVCVNEHGIDRCGRYRGLSPTSDDDAEPKGDGTAGDGFTAFEEYRGFVTRTGACDNPLRVSHARKDPTRKNLFIHSPDPMLSDIADDFDGTSGLDIDLICPLQYLDNETRIVNFTMHRNPGEGIRGARLTQDRPQHGLHLVNAPAGPGVLGRSFGFGPPKNVRRVAVDMPRIRTAYGAARFDDYLRLITHHELGHAVGIRHHGDRNIPGPIVLLNTPGCVAGMTEGLVAGQPACSVSSIAVRGQQNSGNAFCPMKYIQWSWYVPPGWSLRNVGPVEFQPNTSWSWSRPRVRDAYRLGTDLPNSLTSRPQVRRYRKDLDNPPETQHQQFCTSANGTGINGLPADDNHAGHASRSPSCASQLRVNDVPRDR